MSRDLKVQDHPCEEGGAEAEAGIAQNLLESEVTNLDIVQDGDDDETVEGGEVFDECLSPHEYNCSKLCQGNISKDDLLQSQFGMRNKQLLIDPNDGGVVDEIQEEEIVEDGLADLGGRLFDDGSCRGLSNYCVDADPGEKLEDVVHAIRADEPAASEDQQDHSRSSNDGSVYVERCDDRYDKEREDDLAKQLNLLERGVSMSSMTDICGSRSNHERCISLWEFFHGVVQEFIDDQNIQIKDDFSQGLNLMQRKGDVVILKGALFLIVHEHASLVPSEHQIRFIIQGVVFILDYGAQGSV